MYKMKRQTKHRKTNVEKLQSELGIHTGGKRHRKGKQQANQSGITRLSRKERRKAERKQKKRRNAAFYFKKPQPIEKGEVCAVLNSIVLIDVRLIFCQFIFILFTFLVQVQ
jgi:hypothetical protein